MILWRFLVNVVICFLLLFLIMMCWCLCCFGVVICCFDQVVFVLKLIFVVDYIWMGFFVVLRMVFIEGICGELILVEIVIIVGSGMFKVLVLFFSLCLMVRVFVVREIILLMLLIVGILRILFISRLICWV